jgi:excisionase family DNA binding protein
VSNSCPVIPNISAALNKSRENGKAPRNPRAAFQRLEANMKSRPTSSSPKFYTIRQIADCTEVSERTVRRWIKKHWLIVHRIEGLVRISDSDYATFLGAHRNS